jgi:hypothetical protein
MRRVITLAIAVLCLPLCWITTPSQSAELSGAWKVATRGGPTPICSFIQAGSNLNGSCIGPQATGTVAGTVFGSRVQWRWQWLNYGGNTAAAFDFTGTLQPDNSIAGMIERPEIGLSLNFTAKRIADGGAAVPPAQSARDATGPERIQAGRSSTAMAGVPQASDQELEQMSRRIFNPAGNYGISADTEAKRQQWLYDAKQSRIKNQIEMMKAGHDYSVEWRNR